VKKSHFTGIGSRIRRARKHAQISQLELAQACGWTSRRNVSAIENDHELPSLNFLLVLCKKTEANMRWVLFSDGPERDTDSDISDEIAWLDVFRGTPPRQRRELLKIAGAIRGLIPE